MLSFAYQNIQSPEALLIEKYKQKYDYRYMCLIIREENEFFCEDDILVKRAQIFRKKQLQKEL